MKKKVILGLENLILDPPEYIKTKRLGLLCNPASVDNRFTHASLLIHNNFPGQLKALFSPQHGFYAEKQDNMIESDHIMEPLLNVPIFSLYAKKRIPTLQMFADIDILLIDIQDVGTRVYTFIYTVSYCLEIAAKLNKKVVILDRPNPIGGNQIEGNILSKDFTSFVGRYPIPMRHGMTIGEISQFFNREFSIGCDLKIITMSGWKRKMYWKDTGIAWISPSPNLPTPQSCMVYPGQVIWEGTNISEGRGTALPFEQFGAPFLDIEKIKHEADKLIPGAVLRPVNFEPTSGKWQNNICKGFQIHITDREKFLPYISSLILLQLIVKYHKNNFQLKSPPYEYEYKKMPLDLILGSKTIRKKIMNLENLILLSEQWKDELKNFKSLSMSFKGNKVWAQIDSTEKLVQEKGKVLIKYNLKQDYEYKVKYESLKPEEQAIPAKKKKSKKQGSTKSVNQCIPELKIGENLPDNCIKIYTDGASSGNPGPSGIGILLIYGETKKEISQYIGQGTNNIAELTAIKVALEELKRNDLPVCIFSDSSYSIGLLTKGWKPKKNKTLVLEIRKLLKKFNDISFIKVKGHAGIKENEVADFLATSAIKKGSG